MMTKDRWQQVIFLKLAVTAAHRSLYLYLFQNLFYSSFLAVSQETTHKTSQIKDVLLIVWFNNLLLSLIAMSFDKIPYELKEYIFTYVTPNEWINTGKVSTEWLTLTLWSIKKVESCHLLILDHLAEFLNQHHNANYTWVSLLTMMPRLEHLECCENTEDFWQEISTICRQLKILHLKPRNPASFDWNKLDIRFNNLVELHFDGNFQVRVLPFKLIAFSPKLEKIKVTYVQINAEWTHKIPKRVKHFLLNKALCKDDVLLDNLSEDTSALETFSAERCWHSVGVSTKLCNEASRLKKLELHFKLGDSIPSTTVKNALRNCRELESVKASNVIINDSWRRLIPENVKSIDFSKMNVEENIRLDFSLDWLFRNYACLQSLELRWVDWSGFDSQKFYSTKNLKKLHLDDYAHRSPGRAEPIYLFSDICIRMIRGSHLVDVELHTPRIDESWRHIFPPTIKRLKLKHFQLSKEAELVFSPQFICENPSNIESLILFIHYNFNGYLPAMDLNAFKGMQRLQELHFNYLRISSECLQSILTHCSVLTDLTLHKLEDGALTSIPLDLVLPNLRILNVIEPLDQPSLLLQHFPKVCTVVLAIVPSNACSIMKALEVADALDIRIRNLSWDLLNSLVESIDDTHYKYFCLSLVSNVLQEFSFYWTNSLLNACRKLDDIIISGINRGVLWIKNYPSSTLLRNNESLIPSSIDELSQRFHEITARK